MSNIKRGNEIATIDCELITIEVAGDPDELALNTASKLEVTAQIETQDAIRLVIKGKLRAQKPQENTLVGNTIVITDNLFNPQLVMILQGGEIILDPVTSRYMGYDPPASGSGQKGEIFTLNAYSAIYNAGGIITGYEKISYPNCQGVPINLSSEDGVFRVSSYTINSAPDTGQRPYSIRRLKPGQLPKLPDIITDDPPNITTKATLPNALEGEQYSLPLAATGKTPIVWSVVSGVLPDGITLDEDTGVLSGTPVAAGASTFTIGASNGIVPDAEKEFTLLVI